MPRRLRQSLLEDVRARQSQTQSRYEVELARLQQLVKAARTAPARRRRPAARGAGRAPRRAPPSPEPAAPPRHPLRLAARRYGAW